MLAKVLSLVSPRSSSFPLVSAISAKVLNFHSRTPTGPSLAKRFAHTLLSESCRSIFWMRALTVRYCSEPGGASARARSQAFFAPCQSWAEPASLACCESASNSMACVSSLQDGQASACGSSAVPQFEHRVEVAGSTNPYCSDQSRSSRSPMRMERPGIMSERNC